MKGNFKPKLASPSDYHWFGPLHKAKPRYLYSYDWNKQLWTVVKGWVAVEGEW
jgi:hypothetical protein